MLVFLSIGGLFNKNVGIMDTKTAKAQIKIEAGKEALFGVLVNHEGTHNWVQEVNKVTLLKEGTPKNAKGAIREVDFKPRLWTTVQEEILSYQDNEYYTYSIIEGMPGLVSHLGKWSVEEAGNNETLVTWEVEFTFKKFHWFSPFVNSFVKSFNEVQNNALKNLKAHPELYG